MWKHSSRVATAVSGAFPAGFYLMLGGATVSYTLLPAFAVPFCERGDLPEVWGCHSVPDEGYTVFWDMTPCRSVTVFRGNFLLSFVTSRIPQNTDEIRTWYF